MHRFSLHVIFTIIHYSIKKKCLFLNFVLFTQQVSMSDPVHLCILFNFNKLHVLNMLVDPRYSLNHGLGTTILIAERAVKVTRSVSWTCVPMYFFANEWVLKCGQKPPLVVRNFFFPSPFFLDLVLFGSGYDFPSQDISILFLYWDQTFKKK